MYCGKKISVVVPAFNEEKLVDQVIRSVPDFVDFIIVVDDASLDETSSVACSNSGDNLLLVRHDCNQGVGKAIVSGYKKALEMGADIAVVMAGDAQMDPLDMPGLLEPLIKGEAGYCKGNRFTCFEVLRVMPKIRIAGNIILTLMTKITSGYWRIIDSQCGYTAVSREVLGVLKLDKLYGRYGFPNDMLVKLNVLNVKVKDVPVRPIYSMEKSNIKICSFAPRILLLSVKWFFWRIFNKYVIPFFSSRSVRRVKTGR